MSTQAKSVCLCGHTGDGANSSHAGLNGHGACTVSMCGCRQFTWRDWTREYAKLRDQARRHGLIDGRNGRSNVDRFKDDFGLTLDYKIAYNRAAKRAGFVELS